MKKLLEIMFSIIINCFLVGLVSGASLDGMDRQSAAVNNILSALPSIPATIVNAVNAGNLVNAATSQVLNGAAQSANIWNTIVTKLPNLIPGSQSNSTLDRASPFVQDYLVILENLSKSYLDAVADSNQIFSSEFKLLKMLPGDKL